MVGESLKTIFEKVNAEKMEMLSTQVFADKVF